MTKRKHEDIASGKHSHGKKKKNDSDFSVVRTSTVVSIPPVFASNPREGVLEMLDSMIMRYIPPLGGVVLTHSNLQFLQSTALLQYDCPYAKCSVSFDATIWKPSIGQSLSGKVMLYSPDHISLLVHRTFNVSIPRHHIPSEKCSFQWNSGDSHLEVEEAVNTNGESIEEADVAMTNGEDVVEGGDAVHQENLGSWIDNETGKPLGPVLKFTVIGLTVANQMLSLTGSLQPDPFSPRHLPPAAETEKEKENYEAESQDALLSQEEENGDEAEDAAEVDAIIKSSERDLSAGDDNNDNPPHDKSKSKSKSKTISEEVRSAAESKRKRKKAGDGDVDVGQKEKKKKKSKT